MKHRIGTTFSLIAMACLAAWLVTPPAAIAQATDRPGDPDVARPPPAVVEGRGQLLYDTHCVGCHSQQVHWRDRRVAKDWPSLQAQVVRWQTNLGLDWNADEIEAVSRHLNARHYRYPVPGAGSL